MLNPYGQLQAPPQLKPGIVPLRPIRLGEILDGAFRSIRYAPGVMLGLTATVLLAGQTISGLVAWRAGAGGGWGWGALDDLDAFYGLAELTAFVTAGVIAAPIQAVAMVVVFALLTFAVSRAVLGQRTSIGQAWAAAKSRVPAMIGLVLLVGVVTLGAFVPTFGAIVLAVTVGDARTGFLAVGLTALASLVLVVWGSIKLLFAPSVLVLEGLGPLKSIKRSWGLTRRRWWRLFGITWLVQLLVGLVAQIIATPIMVIGAVLATATAAWVSIVIMLVGPVAATVITTPYTAAVNTLLYIDARMRSEGLDIQLVKAASEHRQ